MIYLYVSHIRANMRPRGELELESYLGFILTIVLLNASPICSELLNPHFILPWSQSTSITSYIAKNGLHISPPFCEQVHTFRKGP